MLHEQYTGFRWKRKWWEKVWLNLQHSPFTTRKTNFRLFFFFFFFVFVYIRNLLQFLTRRLCCTMFRSLLLCLRIYTRVCTGGLVLYTFNMNMIKIFSSLNYKAFINLIYSYVHLKIKFYFVYYVLYCPCFDSYIIIIIHKEYLVYFMRDHIRQIIRIMIKQNIIAKRNNKHIFKGKAIRYFSLL